MKKNINQQTTEVHANTIVHIALPLPLRCLFDYLLPTSIDLQSLKSGIRVKVPFGSRTLIGIYLNTAKTSKLPKAKLKPIKSIIDTEPVFLPSLLKLCQWASQYYHHSLGEVLSTALPVLLRKGRALDFAVKSQHNKVVIKNEKNSIKLNEDQKKAVESIAASLNQFQCFLLDGVTGSGKTEVYLCVIKKLLKQGKQALILVPEISLTPQTLNRFQERFDVSIVSLHSKLTNKERLNIWEKAKIGAIKIIIGTRSAVFTPFLNLGLIVIDEEHDGSFKQQDSFRYSARNLAIVRATIDNIPIVLGSATPSLESFYNAYYKKCYQPLSLPERAGNAMHPHYHIIDIRDQRLQHGLSKELLSIIDEHLKRGNQVLLFLNRRGYSLTLMCHVCGWIANCPDCDAHMTLHKQPFHLHCHYCDKKRAVYDICPVCHHTKLQNVGVGTQRLEKSLQKHFPLISITRIDSDSTRRKHSVEAMIQQIKTGHRQILIGTQMIAKGHHFPNVTLVGIINADSGFFSADFRAVERIGQLLIQVSGRAGRAEKPGQVVIQTHHPQHPLLLKLIEFGYHNFAQLILKERFESQLSPYTYCALFRASAVKQELPHHFLLKVRQIAEQLGINNVNILGPIPAVIARRQTRYHEQLLLNTSNRSNLHHLLNQLIGFVEKIKMKGIGQIRWSLDVDPVEM